MKSGSYTLGVTAARQAKSPDDCRDFEFGPAPRLRRPHEAQIVSSSTVYRRRRRLIALAPDDSRAASVNRNTTTRPTSIG